MEENAVIQYLDAYTEPLDLPSAIETWREDLIQYGLDEFRNREYPND